eukprot:TRINITY_DN63358_c0_g2_i1.p1 TRINITY_DN63358_c0_g2~~TRINITY_DN63358_c0_g2_i1.p1  ORF type:complete len:821 (-),score=105.74 TRINITY_DN63358_c0_g2_i1:129-2591(-)
MAMQRLRVAGAPSVHLPDPSQLSKAPGNNWNDSAFKTNHSKRQMLKPNQEQDANSFRTGITKDLRQQREIEDLGSAAVALNNCYENNFTAAESQPAWLTLDDKVLRYYGFFCEAVQDSPYESRTVRRVSILFYPVDDTVMVLELKQENSGFQGGTLIKRHRVPNGLGNQRRRAQALNATNGSLRRIPQEDAADEKYVTVNDLEVGGEVTMYSKTFHIVGCDDFTREFMESLGFYVAPNEDFPNDEYFMNANPGKTTGSRAAKTWADLDIKMTFEHSVKGRTVTHYPDEIAKMQKFLKDDGKILAFKAVWDDRKNASGDFRRFEIRYYIADDTVEVLERQGTNSGRDPSRAFASRCRLPKSQETASRGFNLTFSHRVNGGVLDGSSDDYYYVTDFDIGITVNVYGRPLRIVDCDPYTRKYFRSEYGRELAPPVDVDAEYGLLLNKGKAPIKIPPHNGFGTEEDSLGNWRNLVLKAPKSNLKQALQYDTKVLRFGMKFHEPKGSEEALREFILTFFLADDTIQLTEVPQRNSGHLGGKFLKRQKVKKYAGEGAHCFYNWRDFHVGMVANICGNVFVITSMDEFTRQFRFNAANLPPEVSEDAVHNMIHYMLNICEERNTATSREFLDLWNSKHTRLPISDFCDYAQKFNLNKGSDAGLIGFMRQFDKDHDSSTTVQQFLAVISNDPLDSMGGEVYEGLDENEKTEYSKQLQMNSLMKKFRMAASRQQLELQDVYRMASTLPRSVKDVTGSNPNNSLSCTINQYQLRSCIATVMGTLISEADLQTLVAEFFIGRRSLSLQEFLGTVGRVENRGALPAQRSKTA